MDKCLDDEFMAELAKRIEESYKKDVIFKYIADVAENCVRLCAVGEGLRALNAVKLMMDNLQKEFDL